MIKPREITTGHHFNYIKCNICKTKLATITYNYTQEITVLNQTRIIWDFCSKECEEYFKLLIC